MRHVWNGIYELNNNNDNPSFHNIFYSPSFTGLRKKTFRRHMWDILPAIQEKKKNNNIDFMTLEKNHENQSKCLEIIHQKPHVFCSFCSWHLMVMTLPEKPKIDQNNCILIEWCFFVCNLWINNIAPEWILECFLRKIYWNNCLHKSPITLFQFHPRTAKVIFPPECGEKL